MTAASVCTESRHGGSGIPKEVCVCVYRVCKLELILLNRFEVNFNLFVVVFYSMSKQQRLNNAKETCWFVFDASNKIGRTTSFDCSTV